MFEPAVLAVSMGGIQSNSMLAIAKIVAQHPSSCFCYITKPIPKFLRDLPLGNYEAALNLGMQVGRWLCWYIPLCEIFIMQVV